jgi:hypothetical protein
MNKMINGAKKISDANGFFIKIYWSLTYVSKYDIV